MSHKEFDILSHPNDKVYCYNIMVSLGTEDNITESTTIIIGGDTITCAV